MSQDEQVGSQFLNRNGVELMKRKSLILTITLAVVLGAGIGSSAFAQGPLTPSASQIDSSSRAALAALYSQNAAASALGSKATAILVFPDIRKGAFLVGAQYGFGALLRGGRTVGYYRTGAASYGFQAGVKKFGYALFFMSRAALNYLDASGGWAIGTGPSLVVVDKGVARSLTTTNLRADVYAFVFDQTGLMGGIGIEGSKITRITPSQ